MGILDDLAMGFGLKEKDRDYYDRTAATIGRNQGSDASDKYKKYVGMTGGPVTDTNSGISPGSAYANASNYFSPIGPSLSDFRQVPNTGSGANPYDASGNLRADYKPGSAAQRYKDVGRPQPGTIQHAVVNSPSVLGLLTNILGGYKAIQPQGDLRSSYRPMSAAQRAKGVAEINERRRRDGPPPMPAPAAQAAPTTSVSGLTPEPVETSIPASDIQLEAFTGQPSNPLYMPGGEFDAFMEHTGQPSDPRYMPGGEFDAFMEHTGSLPAFAPYYNDRKKMMEIFEQYLKTQGGGN